MNNGIGKRQNNEQNIAKLAAQRQLYNGVGIIGTINVIMSVIIPLAFAIIQEVKTDWTWIKICSCCISIVMLILSLFLSSYGKNKRELAASIQQLFDVDVYKMPWDYKLFGQKKNLSDEIAGASKRILRNETEKQKLYNWYPPEVSTLPKLKAIALCQKENFNWDSELRNRYRFLLGLLLGLIIGIFVIIGLVKKQMLEDFLLKFIMVLPVCRWFINTIDSLSKDIKRMDDIKRDVYRVEIKTMEQLQFTQRDIYLNRKNAIKIPNWFYKIFNNNDEDRENRAILLGK